MGEQKRKLYEALRQGQIDINSYHILTEQLRNLEKKNSRNYSETPVPVNSRGYSNNSIKLNAGGYKRG